MSCEIHQYSYGELDTCQADRFFFKSDELDFNIKHSHYYLFIIIIRLHSHLHKTKFIHCWTTFADLIWAQPTLLNFNTISKNRNNVLSIENVKLASRRIEFWETALFIRQTERIALPFRC